MSSASTLVIAINPLAPQRGEYLIQLSRASKTIAETTARIDRQRLLELEYSYNAHDYGMALYAALFNGPVSREYQRLVGKVGADNTLRIQLVISDQAGELHALAWERLFHIFGDAESPLATLAQTPFARFLISGAGDQAATTADPLRLLLVIANPSNLGADFAAIDAAQTVRSMAELVVKSKGRVQGTVLAGRSGLPDALRQQMQNAGWTIAEGVSSWQNIQRHLHGQHILHILAHGQLATDRQSPEQSSTYLLLEHEGDDKTARGARAAVDDKTISTQLSGVHPLPQLILLAACESARRPPTPTTAPADAAERPPITTNPFVGLAPKLVAAGVPAVLAMQDKIEVEMAHTLTLDFYQRLFAHGQVDRALNEARALLYARDSFAWAIPVLFLRLTDGQLFVPPAAPLRRARLQAPAPPTTYAERPAEESQLRTWLTANARQANTADAALTVAIQGIGGQGKSVRLVVLNACSSSQVEGAGLFSGIGPALVNVGVPAVIAMQYEAVYTDTASLFSERFYASLASGLPVDVAVNEARQYLSSKHLADRDWSTPVLYMGTRAGQVLALPGAKVDAAFEPERLIALVNKVMAQLQAAGQHYAELERRSKRLREWLDVQVRIAGARSNADRLNGYVQEAIKLVNKPNRTEADLERGRIRLESVTDQWENDCRQDLTDLTQLLQECTAITQPDQPTDAPAKSSIVGWAAALGAAYQNSDTLFSQDMTAIDNDALKTTCSALDNQGRQLRDWLRDRDNDCRNRLISEATELVSYTTRLGHPEA